MKRVSLVVVVLIAGACANANRNQNETIAGTQPHSQAAAAREAARKARELIKRKVGDIEIVGNRQRIRIQFDHRIELRTASIQRGNPIEQWRKAKTAAGLAGVKYSAKPLEELLDARFGDAMRAGRVRPDSRGPLRQIEGFPAVDGVADERVVARGARGRGIRRERVRREVADRLRPSVLEDREIVLRQAGDRIAARIDDADVERHDRDPGADDGRTRTPLLRVRPGFLRVNDQ